MSALDILLDDRQRGVDALLGTVQVALARLREGLAALPQRDRLLQRQTACLQPADHLHQLVARGLVVELGLGGTHWAKLPNLLCTCATTVATAWSYPTNASANSAPSPSRTASSMRPSAATTRLRCTEPWLSH